MVEACCCCLPVVTVSRRLSRHPSEQPRVPPLSAARFFPKAMPCVAARPRTDAEPLLLAAAVAILLPLLDAVVAILPP